MSWKFIAALQDVVKLFLASLYTTVATMSTMCASIWKKGQAAGLAFGGCHVAAIWSFNIHAMIQKSRTAQALGLISMAMHLLCLRRSW